jgi:hypothetical protein
MLLEVSKKNREGANWRKLVDCNFVNAMMRTVALFADTGHDCNRFSGQAFPGSTSICLVFTGICVVFSNIYKYLQVFA